MPHPHQSHPSFAYTTLAAILLSIYPAVAISTDYTWESETTNHWYGDYPSTNWREINFSTERSPNLEERFRTPDIVLGMRDDQEDLEKGIAAAANWDAVLTVNNLTKVDTLPADPANLAKGTLDIRGNSLTLLVRSRPDFEKAKKVSGLAIRSELGGQWNPKYQDMTVNFKLPVTVDIETFPNYNTSDTPFWGSSGVEFYQDWGTTTRPVTKAHIVFENPLIVKTLNRSKPEGIQLKRNHALNGLTFVRMPYGLWEFVAKEKVDVSLESIDKRRLVGLASYGGGWAGASTMTFEADAAFTVSSTKGGELYGFHHLGGQLKPDDTSLKNAGVQLHSSVGSTLNFNLSSTASTGTDDFRGAYVELSNGSRFDFENLGRLDFKVDVSEADSVYGVYLNNSASSIGGKIGQLTIDTTSIQSKKAPVGLFSQAHSRGTTDLTIKSIVATVSSRENAKGVAQQTFHQGTQHTLNVGSATIKTNSNDSMSVYQFGNAAPSTLSFDEVTIQNQGAAGVDIYTKAINGAHNELQIEKLISDSTRINGIGIYALAESAGLVEVTVTEEAKLADENKLRYGFMSKTDGQSQSHIQLSGALNLQVPEGLLFQASGQGATITVNTNATKRSFIEGKALALQEGELDLKLNGTSTDAYLTLDNNDDPTTRVRRDVDSVPGVVNVTVTDGAKYFVNTRQERANPEAANDSSINTLTLSNGGELHFSGSPKTIFYAQSLKGEGGSIFLDVNPQDATGQRLFLSKTSAGQHTLHFAPQQGATPNGQPIWVVESHEGARRPEAYQASFTGEVDVGELRYVVGDTLTVNASLVAEGREVDTVPAENTKNWYLYPAKKAPEPPTPEEPGNEPGTEEPSVTPSMDPDDVPFNDTATGSLSSAGLHYLAGLTTLETLRQRLGDVHQFMKTDEGTTGWAKLSGANWSLKRLPSIRDWDLHWKTVQAGVDRRLHDHGLAGGYLAYAWMDSSGGTPVNLRGTNVELGAYYTHRWDNQAYLDLVGRVGRTESRFSTTDSADRPVKADHIKSTFWGASAEIGKRFDVNTTWSLEPQAQVAYTHFGHFDTESSAGLRSTQKAYSSLITRLGTTLDARFQTESGRPWTVYGKVNYEREWLAKPDIVFNGEHRYKLDFTDHRWIYGVGLESILGKASSWHVSLERSTGHHFEKTWRLDAGIRIPF